MQLWDFLIISICFLFICQVYHLLIIDLFPQMLYIGFAFNSLVLVSKAVQQIDPKLCGLTQAIYYLKFLWERNQIWISWVLWLRITHKVATKVSARTYDYFKVQPGDDLFPNSFKWLLAEFSSSWALGKDHSSVSCQTFSIGQFTTWQLAFIRARDEE